MFVPSAVGVVILSLRAVFLQVRVEAVRVVVLVWAPPPGVAFVLAAAMAWRAHPHCQLSTARVLFSDGAAVRVPRIRTFRYRLPPRSGAIFTRV